MNCLCCNLKFLFSRNSQRFIVSLGSFFCKKKDNCVKLPRSMSQLMNQWPPGVLTSYQHHKHLQEAQVLKRHLGICLVEETAEPRAATSSAMRCSPGREDVALSRSDANRQSGAWTLTFVFRRLSSDLIKELDSSGCLTCRWGGSTSSWGSWGSWDWRKSGAVHRRMLLPTGDQTAL